VRFAATPGHRNEPPFLRGQVVGTGQASGLVLCLRHHRCGTAPGSHRLRWAQHHPGQQNPELGGVYRSTGPGGRPTAGAGEFAPGESDNRGAVGADAAAVAGEFALGESDNRGAVGADAAATACVAPGIAETATAETAATSQAPPSHTWRGLRIIVPAAAADWRYRHAGRPRPGRGPRDSGPVPLKNLQTLRNVSRRRRRYAGRRRRRGYPRAHVTESPPGARPA